MNPLESAQEAFIEAKLALGGHEVFSENGTRWCFSNRPAGINCCWKIEASESSLTPTIERILDTARVRKSPLDFLIFPTATPENLAKTLRRDWRMMGPMHLNGMTCPLKDTALPEQIEGIEIRELQGWRVDWKSHPLSSWVPKVQKADWWLLHKELQEAKGLKAITAEHQGRPAACACLFCHQGMGLITSVLTFEEFRGRGIGSAVIRACLASAKAQGCHTAGLLGHKKSSPLYERLGFKTEAIFSQLYYSKSKAETQPLFNASPL